MTSFPMPRREGGLKHWMGRANLLLIIKQNTIPSRPKGDGFGKRRNWVGGESTVWGGSTYQKIHSKFQTEYKHKFF